MQGWRATPYPEGMVALRSPRFVLAFAAATVAAALVTGIPTDLMPNPWFTRMTPVRPLDVVLWVLLSPTIGALLATYALPGARGHSRAGSQGIGTGVASVFAIGCPICNKLVVAALGVSGAVTYFAPLQPILGFAALALSLWALRLRFQALTRGCSVPGEATA